MNIPCLRQKTRLFVGAALVSFAGIGPLWAQTAYNLTVKAGPLRQSFYGFGLSQGEFWNEMTPGPRNTMADLAYRDLKTRVFRLWLPCSEDETVASMLQNFNQRYVASAAIADVKSRGVTTLLLAPCRSYSAGWDGAPTESMAAYASRLAEAILQIKNTYGITLEVTGLVNEPELWPYAMVVEGVKELRANLDARGLGAVKIVAPESSSAAAAVPRVDALRADAAAWSSLYAIGSHSYGGVLEDDGMFLRKQGKEWWMTEGAAGGDEFLEDENRACTTLGRMLCELNHGVNQWTHFQGICDRPDITQPRDNGVFLMIYDRATASLFVYLKYYYFKQTLQTFDVGSIFRKCVSATEGDMFRVNNINPAISAAAACNPDGSWGISVVNQTGVGAGMENSYRPAASYNVTVNVEELAGASPKTFTLYRSRANQHFVNAGTVTLTNGQVTFPIAARELVCLRSAATPPAVPVVPSGLTASTINAPVVLNWNNTVGAATWKVKRSTTSGGPYVTIATTTDTRYEDRTAVEGNVYYYVVSAVNATGESANSAQVVGSPCPFPWTNRDFGTVSLPGTWSVSDSGYFAIRSAGGDIGGAADNYNFTYKTMSGNGTLIARVVSPSITNDRMSKIGVMMRESLDPAAKEVCVFHDFHWGYAHARAAVRSVSGQYTSWFDNSFAAAPVWLKIVRSGNTFSSYASADGTAWTLINTSSVTMGNTIYIGLATSSVSSSEPAVSDFDNVGAPPDAPTGLIKTVNAASVQLRWVASYGATSYKVRRALNGGAFTTIATVNAPTLNYMDNISNGVNYSYVVTAVNAWGESPHSVGNYVRPGILWERWQGVAGGIGSIPLSTPPTSITCLNRLESPTDIGELYGDRIRGYLTAPTNGAYTFWIAGDNDCQFYLSPTADPAAKLLQARVESYTASRQWNVFPYQKSAAVNLVAGQKYYFETLHSEGSGGDCLAVGWAKPGEGTVAPSEVVPLGALTPYRGVVREVWIDLPSGDVNSIPVNTAPNQQTYLTSLEGPTNAADNYGDRVRGYITAPVSGYYTFWIAGDNDCKFYLSSSANPAAKVLQASVPFYTAPRAWNVTPEQKSPPISLMAGEKYYFEILHREGGGGDCMAVGWSEPGQSTAAPSEIVPFEVLTPY